MLEEQTPAAPFNERVQTYLSAHFRPTDQVEGSRRPLESLTIDILTVDIDREDRTNPTAIKRNVLDTTLKWVCINGYVDNNDRRYLDVRDIPGVMEHRRNIFHDHSNIWSTLNVADIISSLERLGASFRTKEQLYIYRYALSNSVDRLRQAGNETTEEREKNRLSARLAKREKELAEIDKLYTESSQTDPDNPAISLFRDLPYPWDREYKDHREFEDPYDSGPTIEELDRFILERNEYLERKVIDDEKGNELCQIDVDRRTGQITTIYPAYFQNISHAAEQPEEFVNATDERGDILPERLTREGVRDEQRQYLLATQILLNVKNWGHEEVLKLLVQTRSADKQIDPNRRSLSAHGVAKALFNQDGQRLMHGQEVALIATALETNEELRHGAEPLIIRVWPGDAGQLLEWAKHHQIDDPNTAYLIPMLYSAVNSYPFNSLRPLDPSRRRTRANSVCLIFSKNEAPISLDSSEVAGYEYLIPTEAVRDERITEDVKPFLRDVLFDILRFTHGLNRPEYRSTVKKLVASMLREEVV